MKENIITVEELSNFINEGAIIYNNKIYRFEDYYYSGNDYVMINHIKNTKSFYEVARVTDPLLKIIEKEKNILKVEAITEEEFDEYYLL